MIEVENVTKIVKGKKVLENIKLNFNKGELILLKGANGSGKTMLLRLLAGLISPTTGCVKKDNNLTFGVIIESPTFFMQETAFYNLKYLANINKKIGDKEINEFLKLFGLYENRNDKVKTFSLGMKQRLALCQAVMEDPDVLLLDEPFNAIDEKNLKLVYKLITDYKKRKKLIIIASHGEVNFCKFDKVIKLDSGRICK